MTLETTAMLSALFFMFASIFARVMTIRLILHMKQSVENVQTQKAAMLSEQKDISTQLAIAERNKTSVERKMAKREKKLRELKTELKTYIDEQDRRKIKRDEMKKQLIR
jgi:septal ring factor EnvC (AmiA/AmiB activator)